MKPVGEFVGEAKMKNILFAAAALSALAAAPAMAQTSTVSLTGQVDPGCSFAGQSGPRPLGDISTGVGVLAASAVNVTLGTLGTTVTCNGVNASISVDADPLVGSNAPPNDAPAAFTNIVNYTATAALSGYTQTGVSSIANATTAATATTSTVGLMQSPGSLAITGAALPSGASVLVAGDYTATVTVTIAPGA
jgi:hypothetical protein